MSNTRHSSQAFWAVFQKFGRQDFEAKSLTVSNLDRKIKTCFTNGNWESLPQPPMLSRGKNGSIPINQKFLQCVKTKQNETKMSTKIPLNWKLFAIATHWLGKINFLQCNVTGDINHSPEQAHVQEELANTKSKTFLKNPKL